MEKYKKQIRRHTVYEGKTHLVTRAVEVLNQRLHQVVSFEAVVNHFHPPQPVLNRQPQPQNPNHSNHLVLAILLRAVKPVRRWPRRIPIGRLPAQHLRHSPVELPAVPQRVQRHQPSDQLLVEENLRHRTSPRPLAQLPLPLAEHVHVYLHEPESFLPEEPPHRGAVSAIGPREEADASSQRRLLLLWLRRHHNLHAGEVKLRHSAFLAVAFAVVILFHGLAERGDALHDRGGEVAAPLAEEASDGEGGQSDVVLV